MAANPNPARISDPLWMLWEVTAADTPGIRYGGTYANKKCYHNGVEDNLRNWPGGYCIKLPLDLVKYNRKFARGIDWTMSTAEMIKRTNRLRASALDPDDDRLFAMREFIGTRDGTNVYCLIKDSEYGAWRYDGTRDSSHTWHKHGSIFTKYINDWDALEPIASVWIGETNAQWKVRKKETIMIGLREGDGTPKAPNEKVKGLQSKLRRAGFDPGPVDGVWGSGTTDALYAMRKSQGSKQDRNGVKYFTGWANTQLDEALAEKKAKAAAAAAMNEMKKALEIALNNLPPSGTPTHITIDLPDTITVPVSPANDDD